MNNIYKKLSVILMFLSMIGCFKFNLEQVNGDSFFGTLSPGGIESCTINCGGGESYSRRPLAHGYRISLVYAETTENHQAGQRVTDTHSVDYWSKNEDQGSNNYVGFQALTGGPANWNSVSSIWKRKYLQYTGAEKKYSKLTKQEVESGKIEVETVNSNYENYDFFKNNKKNSDMGVFDETVNNSKCNSYVHMFRPLTGGTSLNYCQSHSGNFFANNAAQAFSKRFFDKDPTSDSYEWKLLNNYIKNCGYNKKNDDKENVISATSEGIVVQLEPVSATVIFDGGSSIVYVGSMAEIFKMWKNKYYNSSYSNYYSNYTDLNPIIFAKAKKKYNKLAGITLSDGKNIISYDNNYNKTALGVVLFNLSEYIHFDCPTQASSAIKSGNTKDLADVIKQYPEAEWLKNEGYKNYGFSKNEVINHLINSASCEKPDCNSTAEKILTGKKESSKDWEKLIKFLNDNYGFSSKKSDEMYNYEAYGKDLINNTKNLCSSTKCKDILAGNYNKIYSSDTLLQRLKNYFKNKYPLLDKMLADSLGMKVACESLPDCPPPEKISPDCTADGSIFTLSDNKEWICTNQGIAYNTNNGQSNNQSSIDLDLYSGKNSYCQETVKFEFPTTDTDNYNVIGSKIFKWGVNTDKENETFGTMVVTRTCKVPAEANVIDISWANLLQNGGKINPSITIYYKPAIPEDAKIDEVKTYADILDVELTNYTVGGDSIKLNYNTKNNYNCNGSCKNKDITMVAEYNLNYGNKLSWYSMHGSSATILNYEETEKENELPKAKYTFIGYGLPTSTLTPTNVSTVTNSYGKYTYDSTTTGSIFTSAKDGNGYLYATVKNIGTLNKNKSTYHFDEYMKFAITNNVDKEHSTLYYSCDYRVRNNLFDYESGDGGDGSTPEGIDVVFRTIELINDEEQISKAFPGMSGNGRDMGANWDKVYSAENGAEQVFNILNSAIYNSEHEPMYRIKLNVPLIQSIRNANKTMRKNKKDPYTNMDEETPSTLAKEGNGFAGYRFYKKDNGEKTYAYSAFLYYLVNSCKASDGGSCLKVSTSNPCIKGNGVHIAGCNQTWWDDNNKNPVE